VTRRIFRYEVPVDDQPHAFTLRGNPLAVEAISRGFLDWAVAFWAENDETQSPCEQTFQVFGTGQPLPDDAEWVGTCSRTEGGLVWHLYEVGQP